MAFKRYRDAVNSPGGVAFNDGAWSMAGNRAGADITDASEWLSHYFGLMSGDSSYCATVASGIA